MSLVSWNDKFNPLRLAEKIEQITNRGRNNNISFDAFGHDDYTTILYSALSMPDGICEPDARSIVNRAIVEAAGKGQVTAHRLKTETNRLAEEHLALPLKRLVLATSVSLAQTVRPRRIRIDGNTIMFQSALPPQYQASSWELTQHAQRSLPSSPPTKYLVARVFVSARTISESIERAFDSFDLVRGTWNLMFNLRQGKRISMGSRNPVNRIVRGPVATVHQPNGKLATDVYWCETEYTGPIRVLNPSTDMAKMHSFMTSVRRRLSKSHYRTDLESAIIRYGRALDKRDWYDSYLRLWSVLEFLTASHRATVHRASFLYIDREYHKQVLNHLNNYRNRFVHASKGSEKIETYLYQLKRYVEDLLMFHLKGDYGFDSREEVGELLELSTNRQALASRAETLASQVELVEYAQSFHGHDQK